MSKLALRNQKSSDRVVKAYQFGSLITINEQFKQSIKIIRPYYQPL